VETLDTKIGWRYEQTARAQTALADLKEDHKPITRAMPVPWAVPVDSPRSQNNPSLKAQVGEFTSWQSKVRTKTKTQFHETG
jgi:hypothetical protein